MSHNKIEQLIKDKELTRLAGEYQQAQNVEEKDRISSAYNKRKYLLMPELGIQPILDGSSILYPSRLTD